MKTHITDIAFFELWLREKRQLAESSIYVYVKSISKFLALNPDLDRIEDYNNFLIDMSVKKRCSHFFSALKAFVEFKFGDTNAAQKMINNLIRPRERHDIVRERKHLSQEKVLEVINYLDEEKHRVIAITQTLTGARAGDIFRLKKGGIVPEEYDDKPVLRLNTLGKGKKRNVVFIHDEVAQEVIMNYITRHEGFGDYYFIELGSHGNRKGNLDNEFALIKMNYQWFWKDLKQALNTAGVRREDFATHDFRRCFARRVWEKYKDIHVLQGLLNHRDPKVTMRYLEQSGLKNIDYLAEMQK